MPQKEFPNNILGIGTLSILRRFMDGWEASYSSPHKNHAKLDSRISEVGPLEQIPQKGLFYRRSVKGNVMIA